MSVDKILTNQPEFSFKNLYNAYLSCRRNKRSTYQAAKFETTLEPELLRLERELRDHTYSPGHYVCFAITDPKLREVWAADFRDRVVHHLLVGYLQPIWEKKFIFHSFACRKNKGAHNALRHIRKAIAPGMFYLQVDVQSFYVSLDKDILFSIVKKYIRNPEILWLAQKIIFNNPTLDYHAKGDPKLLQAVPAHKSLFGSPFNKGLPIGNLTSQFFANVYLNELDQFVKRTLKCQHYFRYMDDMLLIHPSKEQLLKWRTEIKNFLETNLNLRLHPKKQVLQTTDQGINFCGYIIKPNYMLIRKRTVRKLKNNLWQFNKKILSYITTHSSYLVGATNPPSAYDIIFNDRFAIFDTPELTEEFRHIFSSINSVYGFFKHGDCYNLRKTIFEKHFGILKIYLRPANRNYDYFIWKEQ